MFLTDTALYMSSAGKTLKELYPSLMHVTCVAHLLHNCAMRVRAHFKIIDEVIARIKAATIKNKDRKEDFHNAGLPSPDPVITRWATWLRAALYYSENLPAVRTIINNWTSAGLLVSRAKDAINVEGLVSDLVKINQYRTLAANVEFLEGSACTITKAYGLLKIMQFDDDPCAIKDYINKRLSNSDLETIINCINFTIDPTSYALLQKALPTCAAVERLFSMLNKFLRKDRNFDVQIKSSLYSPYYAEASCGAHLRGLAPGQHSSEESSQRWRVVGDTVDLTGPGTEPQTSRTDSVRLATELLAGTIIFFFNFDVNNVKK